MEIIKKDSEVWDYLPEDIKGLISDGEQLLGEVSDMEKVSDYSYLVFPFAKAYEGFLKKMFLDLRLIKHDEYFGDSIRIGRILNPLFTKKRYSVYGKLKNGSNIDISRELWAVWKRGRNLVFHYFPHNFRKLSYEEALDIISDIGKVMTLSVERFGLLQKITDYEDASLGKNSKESVSSIVFF